MIRRSVDLALHPRWIIPIIPRNKIMEKLSVVINNGQIIDILPTDKCMQQYQPNESIDLPKHVLLPGFVNAHTHVAMYLFKGYGDDNDLSDWLNHYIWPMEAKFISSDFISDGVKCGCAEMIRSGTTCFNDMYYLPEETAALVNDIGMRAIICLMGRDKNGTQDSAKATLQQTTHPYPLIHYGMGPHSPYLYDEASLCRIKQLCNDYHCLMHIHVQETADELESSLQGDHSNPHCHKSQEKSSPIANLARLGILDHTCCAHCVHVLESDINLLAKHHASIVHCPHSNLKLASGIAPIQHMLDQGVNVALGTDGASSNNNLNMLQEMRTAALIGKVASGDPKSISAMTALEIATINGARALGLENEIGSIEISKSADLIAIDMDRLETMPVNDLFSNIVYATGRDQITHVWVNGKCLLDNQRLTTIDINECFTKSQYWMKKLREDNPYYQNQSNNLASSPF